MKKILTLCTALILASPLTIYAATDNAQSTQAATQSDSTAADDLSWLETVNKNEIAAGKLASSKATDPVVKQFASHMIEAHTNNLNQTIKMSHDLNVKLTNTDEVTALKKAGTKELTDLKALEGKAFNTAYIDAMVKGHTDVLNKLDTLISNAKDKPLKKFLVATREDVKQHLQMAKDVQTKLGN